MRRTYQLRMSSMDNKWKFRLIHDPMSMGYNLFLYRMTPAGREVMTQDGDIMTIKIIKEGEPAPCVLYLDDEQVQALTDELNSCGKKANVESKTEGLYEAQSDHLKDLRKLLKLK